MRQLIKDIANIFSPFSENVITSSAVRQATRIPIIKNPILISVVTRRVPIRRSSVVMTTHDPNLMELGDVVYELEDGEIIDRQIRE